MKKFILILTIFPLFLASQTSNLEWAFSIGNSASDYGEAMVLDSDGNIYITGHFTDTLDLDPGTGTALHVSMGDNDIYIAKYNSSGAYVWSKSMGSLTNDLAFDLVIDSSDNLYLTGAYGNNIDFDPDTGTAILTGYGPYVCKFDKSGKFIWATKIGSSQFSNGSSVYLHDNQFLYVTGLPTYLSKINTEGKLIWIKDYENLGSAGNDIIVDPNSQLLMTGYFIDSLIFKAGIPSLELYAPGNDVDIFICKLDTTGNPIWAKQIGGIKRDEAVSIVCDSTASMYLTGTFRDQVDFDPESGISNLTAYGNFNDMFVLKLDVTGSYVWAIDIGGEGSNYAYHIDMMNKELYVSGIVVDTSGTEDHSTVVKIDNNGKLYGAQYFRGVAEINDFKLGPSGKIHCVGSFYNTIDFDTGFDVYNLSAGSVGHTDIFLIQFKKDLVSVSELAKRARDFKVYPNPCSNVLNIEGVEGKGKVQILDQMGRVVFEKTLLHPEEKIDVTRISNGYYFVRIDDWIKALVIQ